MSKRLWAVAATVLACAAIVSGPVTTSASEQVSCERNVQRCGKCGDGFCNPSCGENQFTCPRDCAVTAD